MEQILNWMGAAVQQYPNYLVDAVFFLAGCFALSVHWGKVVKWTGGILFILAELLAIWTVVNNYTKNSGLSAVDIIVAVIVCVTAVWAGRSLNHLFSHLGEGWNSPDFST